MQKWPSPFRIQRCLRGLRYPADKDQVIAHAQRNLADEEVIRALSTLGERQSMSPTELAASLGNRH